MKTHKTITITKSWLKHHKACLDGQRGIAKLLPARISTDPEQNIKLAIQIVKSNAGHHVDWFNDRCNGGITSLERPTYSRYSKSYVNSAYNETSEGRDVYRNPEADPGIVAQWLAHAADKLLARQGR